MNNKEKLLLTMLSCGTGDLAMLDDVQYDWREVLDQMDWPDDGNFNFNSLMRAVVDVGIIHIKETVENRICELKAASSEQKLDEDEKKELASLQVINPDKDIKSYHNWLDTNVWIQNNEEIYGKYLQDALDAFTDNTGLLLSVA